MSGIINDLSPFGKELKLKLMEINKTQAWLSAQTKIDQATISMLVRGERDDQNKIEIIKEFLYDYEHGGKIAANG